MAVQASVHQLPPEILSQIFIHAVHGTTNVIRARAPGESHRIPAFKFVAACSYWRSVALATPELWNSISLVISNSKYHLPLSCALVQRLLHLSSQSRLFIQIQGMQILGPIPGIPPILSILCQSADRWQFLDLSCSAVGFLHFISALSLDSLDTFVFTTQLTADFRLPNARSLRIVTLHSVRSKLFLPWGQITDLTVQQGFIPHTLEHLHKMSNLSKLTFQPHDWRLRSSHASYPKPVTSHLTSLTFSLPFRSEEVVQDFFNSLLLPSLTELTLNSEQDHIFLTNKNPDHWSRSSLPSLLTRSSPALKSFTLNKIWIRSRDLIALLHLMPNLTTLSLSEPVYGSSILQVDPMINNHFLTALVLSDSESAALVPNLTSLSLEIHSTESESEYSLGSLLDLIVSCRALDSLHLKAPSESIDVSDSLCRSFLDLRMNGANVSIEDKDGDVLFGRRE